MRPRRIKVIKQQKDWDCGIAALAMLTETKYGEVSNLLRSTFQGEAYVRIRRRGIGVQELVALAAGLNCNLVVKHRAKGFMIGETGILTVRGEKWCQSGHYLILKDGTHVVDPEDGSVWSYEDYVSRHGVRPTILHAWRT